MSFGALHYPEQETDDIDAVLLPLSADIPRWKQIPAPTATLIGRGEKTATPVYRCHLSAYLEQTSAQFTRQQYWDSHHATLQQLIPTRFALLDECRSPIAVVGTRRFNGERTLVERYLDAPIEAVISQVLQRTVTRTSLAEVGNLAATSLFQSCRLIVFLLHWLSSNDIEHAVCTGTQAVRLALKKAGVPFQPIGDADPERLGAERLYWGSYYDNSPKILHIDIKQGLEAIANRYSCTLEAGPAL